MRNLLLAAAGIVGLWFATTGVFVLAMNARRIRNADGLSVFWTVNLLPWALLGLLLDVLFNAALGSVMYLELPRELLFTTRTKRHARGGPGWRRELALWWAEQLDAIDPGHIR